MKKTVVSKVLAIGAISTLVFGTMLGVISCGGGGDAKKTKASDKVVVGYVINNLNDTFQTYVLDRAKAYAAENGIEILVQDGKEDTVIQQDLVNSLIQKGVNGLIIVPADTTAMGPITKLATDAKIPLAYVNRNPFFGKEGSIPDGVFYVGINEKECGKFQMQHIGKEIDGKGGICILQGILAVEGTTKRTEGVREVAENEFKEITVLAEQSGEWQKDKGVTLTENFITTYGDKLSAIRANNDDMALGAITALKSNGLLDKVKVGGIDGNPDALKAIQNGEMSCSVYQDPGQGRRAIEVVHKSIKGETLSDKFNYISPVLITKENVKDFMK